MTAEHGAEQIPVAVKTVEETKYVEEMHKMAKSTEPATEVQEQLSAAVSHFSSCSGEPRPVQPLFDCGRKVHHSSSHY